jgi:hypothetical protein
VHTRTHTHTHAHTPQARTHTHAHTHIYTHTSLFAHCETEQQLELVPASQLMLPHYWTRCAHEVTHTYTHLYNTWLVAYCKAGDFSTLFIVLLILVQIALLDAYTVATCTQSAPLKKKEFYPVRTIPHLSQYMFQCLLHQSAGAKCPQSCTKRLERHQETQRCIPYHNNKAWVSRVYDFVSEARRASSRATLVPYIRTLLSEACGHRMVHRPVPYIRNYFLKPARIEPRTFMVFINNDK